MGLPLLVVVEELGEGITPCAIQMMKSMVVPLGINIPKRFRPVLAYLAEHSPEVNKNIQKPQQFTLPM